MKSFGDGNALSPFAVYPLQTAIRSLPLMQFRTHPVGPFGCCAVCVHRKGKDLNMNRLKFLNRMGTGAAVLGVALCLPAGMLAQSTAPSPETQSGAIPPQSESQSGAQGSMSMHRHHQRNPDRQLKRMTKTLNLTADQQQQIEPILQDRNSQMKKMRDDTSLSSTQRREQGRTLMQDTNQKIEAVLNDTQKEKFEQQNQQRREHMGNHRMGQASGSASGEATPTPPPQQ